MKYNFKLLEISDVEEYKKLRIKSLKNNPSSFWADVTDEEDKDANDLFPKIGITLWVYSDTLLIGMAGLYPDTGERYKHQVFINKVYISPSHRWKGLAKMLLQKLMDIWTKKYQPKCIKLTVSADNTHAIKLYESLGFETYGIEPMWICVDWTFYNDQLMCKIL